MSDEDENQENKPFVSTNRAVAWVCLDCGTKNYSEFQFLEDPQEQEKIVEKFGLQPGTEVSFMPALVACTKCKAEFSTFEEEEDNPVTALLSLRDLLSCLSCEEHTDDAFGDLLKDAGRYQAAVEWALDSLEEPPEDME